MISLVLESAFAAVYVHLTDQQKFYQLLEYTGNIDIGKKLKQWEVFYNCHRPNGARGGKTPYEVLREKLISK